MLTEYIHGAMEQATFELLPDGEGYYGVIPGLDGVWRKGRHGNNAVKNCKKSWRDG